MTPDLSYVHAALRSIATFAGVTTAAEEGHHDDDDDDDNNNDDDDGGESTLIVLESTSYPGTTEDLATLLASPTFATASGQGRGETMRCPVVPYHPLLLSLSVFSSSASATAAARPVGLFPRTRRPRLRARAIVHSQVGGRCHCAGREPRGADVPRRGIPISRGGQERESGRGGQAGGEHI